MNVLDVLITARDLIEPEVCWTRNALARNRYGNPVRPTNPNAVKWCALGAVMCAAGIDVEKDWRTKLEAVQANTALGRQTSKIAGSPVDIKYVNDFSPSGHAGVVQLFELAILEEAGE